LLDLFLDGSEGLFGLGEIPCEGLSLGDQRGRILAFALGHAHSLGVGIALRTQPISFNLPGLTLVFQGAQSLHIEGNAASRQVASDGFGI